MAYLPIFLAFSASFSSMITLSMANAAAMTMGFPPKVFSWDVGLHSMISLLVMQAPTGRPPAIALAMHIMSGSMFQSSQAHIFPVLAKPV